MPVMTGRATSVAIPPSVASSIRCARNRWVLVMVELFATRRQNGTLPRSMTSSLPSTLEKFPMLCRNGPLAMICEPMAAALATGPSTAEDANVPTRIGRECMDL